MVTEHVLVALVVPGDRELSTALLDALKRYHFSWKAGAIWCGDPHRRPLAPVRWLDRAVVEPSGGGWGRLLVGLEARTYEWARTAATVQAVFADDAALDSVMTLWAGSVGITGECDALLDKRSAAVLVPRLTGEVPLDGLAPDDADLDSSGRYFSTVAVFRRNAADALGWLSARTAASSVSLERRDSVGGLLDRLSRTFDVGECLDPRIGAGWWRASSEPPALIDLEHVDADSPWMLNAHDQRPPRTRLSQNKVLALALGQAVDQQGSSAPALRLPGGIDVDKAMRSLVNQQLMTRRTPDEQLPPEPFGSDNSKFVAWLEEPSSRGGALVGRYWRRIYEQRADLRLAFPNLESSDQHRFASWAERSWRDEQRSMLIRSGVGRKRFVHDIGRDSGGLNVVGYHAYELGLGDVVRRISHSLREGEIPYSVINHTRTGSPPVMPESDFANEAAFATNLVVVNADQFSLLASDYSTLLRDRHTIGYWFWELETVPPAMVEAIRFVDEIWTGSNFVASAFSAVTDKPVLCIPIPVAEPTVSSRSRQSFGLPDDRMIMLVTFDHFSVTERKNPFSAIEAFRQAFAPGEGPLLVIKTLNGDIRWQNHERVLIAASGRDDIVVIDEHFNRGDQMALLAHADCLVSLHRSEGLGLHCAEAMWLGTPVIASRYSGNLDFMDDSCSALIDVAMVPVTNGEGAYPSTSMWADPDVDQAAEWMRRLADDRLFAKQLGEAGRHRMLRQPGVAETGRLIATRAGITMTAAPRSTT